jgi:DNA-binding CsgD family transcriptional regulator
LLEPAAERARSTSAVGAWIWFAMSLGEIARDTGRGHEAVRRFAEVAEVAPTVGQHAALVWAHVGVAQGHLLLGDCSAAAKALAQADDAGDSPVATSWGTRERTRAWLDMCRGDLVSARRRITDTLASTRNHDVVIFEAALAHDLVRLGVPEQAIDRLEVLASKIDGPLVAAHLANARALLDGDPLALHQVVDDYEAMDALALAAEAAAVLADLHRARDESRLATAALQRSAELAERVGGLHTPVLARGAGVERLTAREREVALLVANGWSSRDVADHLGVSTRTVETHLARVYRKLGITSRSELAAALER